MGDKLAQTRRETLLPGIVEMALITEEDHLAFGERRFDCGDGSLWQIAGELYTVDLRADAAGEWADVEIVRDRLRPLKRGHEIAPLWRQAGATYRVAS
jgi:hypothetical protein